MQTEIWTSFRAVTKVTLTLSTGVLVMSDTVFIAKALTKTSTSGEVRVHALRGLDLEIPGGEVVCSAWR